MKKKIGVFAGDLFWSSCPYECLDVFESVRRDFKSDLIMFKNDIRLNKRFGNLEKYYFDKQKFIKADGLRVISTWEDFYRISEEYSIVLNSSKIAPKTRFPRDMKNRSRCPIVSWDVGGADILTYPVVSSDYFLTKGDIWSSWIEKLGHKNKTVSSGTPQYDPFFKDYSGNHEVLKYDEFLSKYSIKDNSLKILIAPTNPGSHVGQFDKNLQEIENLLSAIDKNKIAADVLVKTYPHDYLFYENERPYTGVYKRFYKNRNSTQYDYLLSRFPEIKVIDSQDHFSSIINSNYLFNISGSHIAWETFFSDCESFSMNYSDQSYFGLVSSGSSFRKTMVDLGMEYPDKFMNSEIKNIEELFKNSIKNKKDRFLEYFVNEQFYYTCNNSIKTVLGMIYGK